MLPLACRIPLFSAFGGAAVSLPQALFSLTSSFSCCRSVSIFSLKPVSTAAGLRSPPPNIGGVVPTGPPKWLPSPPRRRRRLSLARHLGRDAKAGEPYVSGVVDQHVFGIDIFVDQTTLMCMTERRRQVNGKA